MSYLLYGEDTYRSRQKLNAIKTKYIDKNLGDTNLATLNGATSSYDEITRQVLAVPFLAPKRLIILTNFLTQGPKAIQEQLSNFLPKTPNSAVIIFYEEGTVDKRTALFRRLNLPKNVEEFAPLSPPQLRRWLNRRVLELGVSIAPQAMERLIAITGPDLWRLNHEINQLALYAPDGIEPEAVDLLVHVDPTGDIFQSLDALTARQPDVALNHLYGRLAQGDSPLYILSMMVYAFRNLIVVKDLLTRHPHQQSAFGMHPFVFRRAKIQAQHYTYPQLKAAYRFLEELDYAIKTGIIEPMVALDLFIFELCYGQFKEGVNDFLASD